jgi:hypothetical protein
MKGYCGGPPITKKSFKWENIRLLRTTETNRNCIHEEIIPFLSYSHALHPEDGGSNVLRNVGVLPQHHTVSQPRRWRLKFTNMLNSEKAYYHSLQNALSSSLIPKNKKD